VGNRSDEVDLIQAASAGVDLQLVVSVQGDLVSFIGLLTVTQRVPIETIRITSEELKPQSPVLPDV